MGYSPNRSGHRALKALAAGPLSTDELRDVINPSRPIRSLSKVLSMRTDGLIWPGHSANEITDIGREALTVLDAGGEWTPFRTSVRLFVSSQGGAGDHNLRAEG